MRSGRAWLLPAALLAPAVLFNLVFFILPLGAMLLRSLFPEGAFGLAKWEELLATPLYLRVVATTLRFSIVTTLGCLVLGYPVALLLVRSRGTWRNLLLLLVLVPYWLDYIVRTYAWMILLGRNGFVNQILLALGLVDVPRTWLGTDTAVAVGMIQVMLPLMILSLYAALLRVDPELLRAAAAHGAGPAATFRHVVWPLALPGAVAGSLLVFVNCVGFYITPAMLGGPRQTMISQSIDVLASRLLDWPLAAAAATLLLAATLTILVAFNRWFGFERLPGGRG